MRTVNTEPQREGFIRKVFFDFSPIPRYTDTPILMIGLVRLLPDHLYREV